MAGKSEAECSAHREELEDLQSLLPDLDSKVGHSDSCDYCEASPHVVLADTQWVVHKCIISHCKAWAETAP